MIDSEGLFSVVGAQRSGTTVFRALLESAGCAKCGEILHDRPHAREERFYTHLGDAIAQDPKLASPVHHRKAFQAFLAEVMARRSGPIAVDVKSNMLHLIPHPDWSPPRPWLADFLIRNAKIVFVVRRWNVLRQLVSLKMAVRTDRWVHRADHDAAPEPTLTLEPLALVGELDDLMSRQEELERCFLGAPNAYRLGYEEMFTADGSFSERALLAAKTATGQTPLATPTMTRQNPEPLHALVDNLDEVVGALTGTPSDPMLLS